MEGKISRSERDRTGNLKQERNEVKLGILVRYMYETE